MASAFFRSDRRQWTADFRGYLTPKGGKRRTMRIPAIRIRNAETAAEDAQAFAAECEQYARLLEGRHQPEHVKHAEDLGVITAEQAEALRTGRYVPLRASGRQRLTIRDAALSHPSSARDRLATQVRYLAYLDAFSEHAGVKHLADVTLESVTSWIKALTARGWAWDTRRHALLYLRRACMMAPRSGLPDALAEMRINQRERGPVPAIRTWTLAHLLEVIDKTEDPRMQAALALGGLLGLRPSEIIRATCEDLEGDILHVGRKTAKNAASVRSLPIPARIAPWLSTAKGDRSTGPLIATGGKRPGRHYTANGLWQTMTNKGELGLATKDLRKTFATWASEVIGAIDLERWLGHRTVLHATVTDRHYLGRHLVDQLRPAAKAMNEALAAALRPAKRSKPTSAGRRIWHDFSRSV